VGIAHRLPPGRRVSEPNVRPETFGQVMAGSGDSRETGAQHGRLCGSIT
jgi:hypothetical protein